MVIMTDVEYFHLMWDISKRGNYSRLTTLHDEIILCDIQGIAEDPLNDEGDVMDVCGWDIYTIEKMPKTYSMFCNFIKSIKEVPWQQVGKPSLFYREAHPHWKKELENYN